MVKRAPGTATRTILAHTPLKLHILAFFLSLATLSAIPQPELSADDPLVFDQKQKKISASNNAHFEYQNLSIFANYITYGTESSVAEAMGDVVLSNRNARIVGDRLRYKVNDQQLAADYLRYGQFPLFFYSTHLNGDPNILSFYDTTVFLGEPDCYSLNLKAKNTTLTFTDKCFADPDYICAEDVIFRLGKVPFFYLPYMRFPIRESPIDIDAQVGRSDQLGYFSQNTILFNQFPEAKWGVLIDYYTKRGFFIGPVTDYAFTFNESCLKGCLRSGYIHDHGPRSTNSLDRPIPSNRDFIEWKHQQTFGSNIHVNSLLRYWSDSKVVRDFRPSIFSNNPEPDNFLEAIYLGPSSYISLFTRYRPNNFNTIQERIPEINFDLVPTPFFVTPFYHQANANIVYLRQKNTGTTQPEEYSYRFDSYYGLTYPIALTDFLTVTPVLGGKLMHYFKTSTQSQDLTRLRGQIGFDAQFNAFGAWDCCNDFWEINGLRHIIKHTIQYRYIPQTSFGPTNIPIIEGNYPTTNLKPIDLAEFRDRDFVTNLNTLRLSLENFFQTRSCQFIPRELGHLHLYQDINFLKRPNEKRLSDFFTDFYAQPFYWINFNLFSRFNFESLTLHELRTRLCIQDGRVWNLAFTSDDLIYKTNQYTLSFNWNVTSKATLVAYFRYDAKIGKLVEQTYGLDTRVKNIFRIQYYISFLKNTTRENGFKPGINISLIR